MIKLTTGMKAIAVGLGKSGLAAVQYLHSLGLKTAASEYKKQITAEEQAVTPCFPFKLRRFAFEPAWFNQEYGK